MTIYPDLPAAGSGLPADLSPEMVQSATVAPRTALVVSYTSSSGEARTVQVDGPEASALYQAMAAGGGIAPQIAAAIAPYFAVAVAPGVLPLIPEVDPPSPPPPPGWPARGLMVARPSGPGGPRGSVWIAAPA